MAIIAIAFCFIVTNLVLIIFIEFLGKEILFKIKVKYKSQV